MTLIEKRWVEVQLYNMILKIYHINNDTQDIMYIIEIVSSIFKMRTEALKMLATKLLYNLRARPTKKEYAILAFHFKVPISTIAQHTGYSSKYLYKQIKTWDITTLNIYPNEYTNEEYALMQELLKNIHKLKEWLV